MIVEVLCVCEEDVSWWGCFLVLWQAAARFQIPIRYRYGFGIQVTDR